MSLRFFREVARRRYLRFKLRTLLTFIFGWCLVLGAVVNQAEKAIKQRTIVTKLQNSGVDVSINYWFWSRDQPITGYHPIENAQDALGIFPAAFYYRYTGIDMEWMNATDEDLKLVAQLPHVRWLHLNVGSRISDEGLGTLLNLVELERLSIPNSQITDTGLCELRNLPQLRYVSLGETNVTKEGLADFRMARPDVRIEAIHVQEQ